MRDRGSVSPAIAGTASASAAGACKRLTAGAASAPTSTTDGIGIALVSLDRSIDSLSNAPISWGYLGERGDTKRG